MDKSFSVFKIKYIAGDNTLPQMCQKGGCEIN
jgi:hypothetical protein